MVLVDLQVSEIIGKTFSYHEIRYITIKERDVAIKRTKHRQTDNNLTKDVQFFSEKETFTMKKKQVDGRI